VLKKKKAGEQRGESPSHGKEGPRPGLSLNWGGESNKISHVPGKAKRQKIFPWEWEKLNIEKKKKVGAEMLS